MYSVQSSKAFRNFAKHLFLVSRTHKERNKAKEDVDEHLHRMRRSVIRMSLTYSEIRKILQARGQGNRRAEKADKYFAAGIEKREGIQAQRNKRLRRENKRTVRVIE